MGNPAWRTGAMVNLPGKRAEVERLLARGLSYREIGRQVGISYNTISRYAKSLPELDAGETPNLDVATAKKALDHRYAEFDAAPSALHYARWTEALRTYEAARLAARG